MVHSSKGIRVTELYIVRFCSSRLWDVRLISQQLDWPGSHRQDVTHLKAGEPSCMSSGPWCCRFYCRKKKLGYYPVSWTLVLKPFKTGPCNRSQGTINRTMIQPVTTVWAWHSIHSNPGLPRRPISTLGLTFCGRSCPTPVSSIGNLKGKGLWTIKEVVSWANLPWRDTEWPWTCLTRNEG